MRPPGFVSRTSCGQSRLLLPGSMRWPPDLAPTCHSSSPKDGTELSPVELASDYTVLVVLPAGVQKASTASVYEAFSGADGFGERRAALERALEAGDIAALPANDLASSPLAHELNELGAFRADVSGAGPAVYGLFAEEERAEAARAALANRGHTWLTKPAWYG